MKKLKIVKLGLFFLLVIFLILIIIIIKRNSEKAVLSLTFDDGYKEHYKIVYPMIKKYGLNGTEYIVANWSGLFEGRELMTFEQAKEMQGSGWEIGSHSLNHRSLPSLPLAEIEKELKESKKILEEKGFVINSLAFPYGHYNQEIMNLTKLYYKSAKSLLYGYNSLKEFNPYTLKSKWIRTTNSPEEICGWIKYAKNKGFWLILNFHYIGDEQTEQWDKSVEDFEKVIKCAVDSKIKVKTINEIIQNEKT